MKSDILIHNYKGKKHWASKLNILDVELLEKSLIRQRLLNTFKHNLFNTDAEIKRAVVEFMDIDENHSVLSKALTTEEKKEIVLKIFSETSEGDDYELKNVVHSIDVISCSDKDLSVIHTIAINHKLDTQKYQEVAKLYSDDDTLKTAQMFCGPDRTRGYW